MSAEIIYLYDNADIEAEVADLEALWKDFLKKRDVSLAKPTVANCVMAGRAYGNLLAALAHADDASVEILQTRGPR